MPVQRHNIYSRSEREPLGDSNGDEQQHRDANQKMQGMRDSDGVEKTAGGAAREIYLGSNELTPSDYLTDKEPNTQDGGDAPEVATTFVILRNKAPASKSQNDAAGKENGGVKPQNQRKAQVLPIVAR